MTTRTVVNNGQPTMAENYHIARLMVAMREAGLDITKNANIPANAGITPYLALVRALDMGTESERIIGLKRMIWALVTAAGGKIEIPLSVMQDFKPDSAIITQGSPDFKSGNLIVEAKERAADFALKGNPHEDAQGV